MNVAPISNLNFLRVLQQWAVFTFRGMSAFVRGVPLILIVSGFLAAFLLRLYLSQLSLYLIHPLDPIGSRVLGIAAASILVMLFWHSVVVSVIVEVVLRRRIAGRNFLGIKKWQWRLYAANLKLVLITSLYLCVFWPVYSLVEKIGMNDLATNLVQVTLIMPLAWFLIRAWFFLLPVCMEAKEEEVLVKSFRMSEGYFWGATAILSAIVGMTLLVQGGAELLLRMFHFIEPLRSSGTIAGDLRQVRTYLGPVMVPLLACYFLTVMVSTIVRIRAYEGVGRRKPSLTLLASE